MPKITINERDLTSPGLNQSTTNTVFIPGYAITGPINTPTLCNNLEDFQNTFGSLPYTFKTRAYLNENFTDTDYFFEAGSPERSYIYATEALKRGLPVLYTRVFNETNKEDLTAAGKENLNSNVSVIIKASSPGEAGEYITCTLTPGNPTTNIPMKLVVNQSSTKLENGTEIPTGLKEITEYIYIGFTNDEITLGLKNGYNIVMYNDINLDLVKISFSGIDSDTLDLSDFTTELTIKLSLNPSGVKEFNPSDIYTKLTHLLNIIEDEGEYSIKFITSGAYPTFILTDDELPSALDKTLADTAKERGDCLAIIDAVPSTKSTAQELLEKLNNSPYGESGPYATMFTPAGLYNCSSVGKNLIMPASFGYITAYATSVQSNPGWLAVAGATRGVLTNLISPIGPKITSSIIDDLQARDNIPINPITLIKPYGNLIWGNRTLKNNSIKGNLTAQSFLNIRCLLCDLKKVIYTTAKGLTFEQNTDILWINFKAGIVPTLEQMVTGGGLTGYEIKKVKTSEKAKIKALIRLYAVEAVEDFDIDIELTDSEITTVE